jgi:hypothetical protein
MHSRTATGWLPAVAALKSNCGLVESARWRKNLEHFTRNEK